MHLRLQWEFGDEPFANGNALSLSFRGPDVTAGTATGYGVGAQHTDEDMPTAVNAVGSIAASGTAVAERAFAERSVPLPPPLPAESADAASFASTKLVRIDCDVHDMGVNASAHISLRFRVLLLDGTIPDGLALESTQAHDQPMPPPLPLPLPLPPASLSPAPLVTARVQTTGSADAVPSASGKLVGLEMDVPAEGTIPDGRYALESARARGPAKPAPLPPPPLPPATRPAALSGKAAGKVAGKAAAAKVASGKTAGKASSAKVAKAVDAAHAPAAESTPVDPRATPTATTTRRSEGHRHSDPRRSEAQMEATHRAAQVVARLQEKRLRQAEATQFWGTLLDALALRRMAHLEAHPTDTLTRPPLHLSRGDGTSSRGRLTMQSSSGQLQLPTIPPLSTTRSLSRVGAMPRLHRNPSWRGDAFSMPRPARSLPHTVRGPRLVPSRMSTQTFDPPFTPTGTSQSLPTSPRPPLLPSPPLRSPMHSPSRRASPRLLSPIQLGAASAEIMGPPMPALGDMFATSLYSGGPRQQLLALERAIESHMACLPPSARGQTPSDRAHGPTSRSEIWQDDAHWSNAPLDSCACASATA